MRGEGRDATFPHPSFDIFVITLIRANAMIVEESISANTCFTEEEHSGLTTFIYLWITGSDIRKKNDPGTFPISFRCVALDESVDKRGVGIVERETCISFNKTINNFEKLLIVHYVLNKLFKFVDLIFHETRINQCFDITIEKYLPSLVHSKSQSRTSTRTLRSTMQRHLFACTVKSTRMRASNNLRVRSDLGPDSSPPCGIPRRDCTSLG